MSQLRYPTDCAPMIGRDKRIGWNECHTDEGRCVPCVPDENMPCGQMMLASGLTLAPPTCVYKCCQKDSLSETPIPKPPSDKPEQPPSEDPEPKTSNDHIILVASISSIAVLILLVAFVMYIRARSNRK